jgi:hypothetical protein
MMHYLDGHSHYSECMLDISKYDYVAERTVIGRYCNLQVSVR